MRPKPNEINQSESINLLMVSKLPELKQMYLQAAEDVAKEKAFSLYRGWQEWHRLDEESKNFVRGYMKR